MHLWAVCVCICVYVCASVMSFCAFGFYKERIARGRRQAWHTTRGSWLATRQFVAPCQATTTSVVAAAGETKFKDSHKF